MSFTKATGAVLLTAALGAGGCASQPEVPEAEFATVREAIEQSEQVEGMKYAGSEMLAAERKLQQARNANQSGDPDKARFLLAEARLHAEQAEVAAMEGEAKASLEEIQASMAQLRRELDRS